MKKILLTVVLVLTTMAASAQWYAGGGIGISKTEISGVESTQLSLTPEVGYAINEDWTVGAILGVDWTKDLQTTIAITPYARYTFFKTGNFSFFADGVIELGSIKPENGDSQFCWGIGVRPGIGYSFTEKISVATHLGWLGHRNHDDLGESTAIILNGNDLSLSIYYNF